MPNILPPQPGNNDIFELIADAIESFAGAVERIFRALLNFAQDIVGWLRSLGLKKNRDTPFVVKEEELKEKVKDAPIRETGLFGKTKLTTGVYNEEEDEITNLREITADEVDQQTKDKMGDDTIIILD